MKMQYTAQHHKYTTLHFQTPEGNNRGDAIHYTLSQTTHANTHVNTWSEDKRAWPSAAAATCCRYVECIEIEWK